MASAHPLWAISEVVLEVMKQSSDQRSLARWARVSRRFTDAALEVLWEKQTGLDRVLDLLPASFKRVEISMIGDEDEEGGEPDLKLYNFVLYDNIRDDEWARLEYYANFVRTYVSFEHDKVDALGVGLLIQKLSGRALFPRLKHLTWRRLLDTSSLFVIFLSPMLHRVRLEFLQAKIRRPDRGLGTIPTPVEYASSMALRMIQACAPMIKHIELRSSALPCLVENLRNFSHLQSLDLREVHNFWVVFDLCSSLASLQDLSIHLARPPGRGQNHPQANTRPTLTHPTLDSLTLTVPSELAELALDAVHTPKLRSLDLTSDAVQETWRSCAALVVSRFSGSLRNFRATIQDGVYDEDEQNSFHGWFSPLYALRELRKVVITSFFDTSFYYTTRDVETIASAWTNVQVLHLPAVQAAPDPLFSITALEAFARKCPYLKSLWMPLPDLQSFIEDPDSPMSVYTNVLEELRFLNGTCRPEIRQRCLEYLQRLFPSAHSILFDEDLDF
ncbi:hypothetical protein C2E23DRAFT_739168 [Lenzites betulinus]|nr:hypothetical protein C2E23DRAFT_739168 [Lenzites betulinus]